jgi:serine/threonine protein kinase/tetratricopeptide (TPR) repeat protein
MASLDATNPSDLPAERPSSPEAGATVAAPLREGPGTRIGPYKLLQLIGEGGFGSVFMAQQDQPVQRTVALKIIKLGMDTRQVIARFEAERQALAMMDHANIARVLDAGATDSGRPFFVMELVKGDPIVEYCDKNNLSVSDRLDMFAQVCAAVQHAHTKGIIHRDIKPSNILVSMQDGRPNTKIIDFGIAKATTAQLTNKTLYTEHRQFIGTPEYMSPEQAEGSMDIDTRTDVYSLGVLLYELLTGTTPFSTGELRSAAHAEIQRIIREVEPVKPSTRLSHNTETSLATAARRHTEPRKLHSLIRGDLDWIVMKALEKDRTRRYETANGLAMDIRRFLRGEAVTAAPPGATYRVRKFIKRHRGIASAGAAVAAALMIGAAAFAWQAVRATHQKNRAEAAERTANEQAEVAKAVNDFLNNDLLAAAAPSTEKGKGIDVTMREVLEEASHRIETDGRAGGRFANKPLVEAAIRDTLAQTFRSLGLNDRALPHATRSMELRQTYQGPEHPETLRSMRNLATIVMRMGKNADAEQLFKKTLEVQKRVLGPEDPETLRTISGLVWALNDQEKRAEAQLLAEQTLEIQRRILGPEHPDTLSSLANLAGTYYRQGKYRDEQRLRQELVDINRRVQGPDHPVTLMAMYNLGNACFMQGKYAEAQHLYEQSWEGERRVLGPEHAFTLNSLAGLAATLGCQGHYQEAERFAKQVLEVMRRVSGPDNGDTLQDMGTLADIYMEQDKDAEAEPLLVAALSAMRRMLGPETLEVCTIRSSLIRLYTRQHRSDDARPVVVEQLQVLRTAAEAPSASPAELNRYAWLLLTAEPAELRNPAIGFEYARRAAAAGDGTDGSILHTLAMAYHLKGDHRLAVDTEERAISLLPTDDAPGRKEAESNLALFRAALQAKDTDTTATKR